MPLRTCAWRARVTHSNSSCPCCRLLKKSMPMLTDDQTLERTWIGFGPGLDYPALVQPSIVQEDPTFIKSWGSRPLSVGSPFGIDNFDNFRVAHVCVMLLCELHCSLNVWRAWLSFEIYFFLPSYHRLFASTQHRPQMT